MLSEDPDNASALAGIKEIEDTYASWARAALDEGNIERARTNLDKLKSVNPEHAAVAELTAKMKAAADAGRIDALVRACETAAAEWENGREVRFDDIDPEVAVPACERAVEARPSDFALQALLCRVLSRAESDDAFEACRSPAEQGIALAQNVLGFMYMNGRGVARSDEQAVSWYRKAAEQGHEYAKKALSRLGAN